MKRLAKYLAAAMIVVLFLCACEPENKGPSYTYGSLPHQSSSDYETEIKKMFTVVGQEYQVAMTSASGGGIRVISAWKTANGGAVAVSSYGYYAYTTENVEAESAATHLYLHLEELNGK